MTGYSEGIRNERSNLMGGSVAVTDAVDMLIKRGLKKKNVMKAISENPEKFLHII